MGVSDDRRVRAATQIPASLFRLADHPRGLISVAHTPSPPYVHFFGEMLLAFTIECQPGGDVVELFFAEYLFPDDPSRDGKELDTVYTFGRRGSYEVLEAASVEHRAALFAPPSFGEREASADVDEFVLCYDIYESF